MIFLKKHPLLYLGCFLILGEYDINKISCFTGPIVQWQDAAFALQRREFDSR